LKTDPVENRQVFNIFKGVINKKVGDCSLYNLDKSHPIFYMRSRGNLSLKRAMLEIIQQNSEIP